MHLNFYFLVLKNTKRENQYLPVIHSLHTRLKEVTFSLLLEVTLVLLSLAAQVPPLNPSPSLWNLVPWYGPRVTLVLPHYLLYPLLLAHLYFFLRLH